MLDRATKACPPSRQGQARRSDLLNSGLNSGQIAALVKDGGLLRLRRGSYALAPLAVRGRHLLSGGEVDHGYLAEVRSVLHSLGDAVADRRTAALLWRMDMLVEPKLVEVRVARTRTRVGLEGVTARCSTMEDSTTVEVAGFEALALTTAVDTVLDCCLDRPMQEAVVIADSALRRELVTVEELERAVSERANTSGVRTLRRLLKLVDPSSGSVLESMLRYLLNNHDLWPSSQVTLSQRDGRRIGRVDFCFAGQHLVIECDGRRWHDPMDTRDRDRRRDNGLARTQWLVLRFTWDEVRYSPSYVLACVRDALIPAAA